MLLDANKELDIKRAKSMLQHYIDKGKIFELREKKQRRSIPQNSYMHLLFSWFALETGYTAAEVKQEIFKKIVNPDLFYDSEKEGIITIQRWHSTASLSKDELTMAIDRFRNYSAAEAGIYLPEPSDLNHIREIEIQIENHKTYL